jgi:hypothetical protein
VSLRRSRPRASPPSSLPSAMTPGAGPLPEGRPPVFSATFSDEKPHQLDAPETRTRRGKSPRKLAFPKAKVLAIRPLVVHGKRARDATGGLACGGLAPGSRAAHATGPVTDLSRTLLCAGFCGKPALPGPPGQRHPTRRAKWFLGRPLRRALRSGVHVGPGAGPSRPAPGDTPRSDGRSACCRPHAGRDRRAARRYVHPGSTCVRRAASPRRSWKSR